MTTLTILGMKAVMKEMGTLGTVSLLGFWLRQRNYVSSEQCQQIKIHYGRDDIDSINSVKEIYKAIGISKIWNTLKTEKFAEIHTKANVYFKPEHEIFKQIVLSYVNFADKVFTS